MGMFSWFTQDTNHRIVADKPYTIIMSDDKGNEYVEHCYEGYGEFGGKDYYELMAEMNGYTLEGCNGNKDELRSIGINLAFDGNGDGMSAKWKYPSLTENGDYYDGESPQIDPNQGFEDDEDEWY